MTPAFRHGSMTPWGGNKLSNTWGKGCPEQTGESLELSAIPGLESQDGDGNTLSALIKKHGEALLGTRVPSPFPLLLKLIDAKEQLSVQVHPGDAYAKKKHNKLGKNEAWVILSCEPNAQLIAGLQDGVSLNDLEEAMKAGSEVEGLLRHVDVSPGEVYYIPEGTVHAIGAGLVLYEIQQSSDLTYRLYDWGRVDQNGQGRELHMEDSLAVVNLNKRPEPEKGELVEAGEMGQRRKLLDNAYFRLDRLEHCQGLTLKPDNERFSVITAISDMKLTWDYGQLMMKAGQTAMLPADGYTLYLDGEHALWATPAIH